MSDQVLAALLGALVGGLASGVAALGGSVIVERMKLRTATRIRMYEELLPPIHRTITGYIEERIRDGELYGGNPRLGPEFVYNVEHLKYISAMAGPRDRLLTSRISNKVAEYETLVRNGEELDYQRGHVFKGDRRRLAGDVMEIQAAISDLSARLRSKVG
jgi:hypothetical protein